MIGKGTRRPVTVAGLMLGLFMGALEMTVVSTAMPTAIGDLGGIEIYSWVFAAYMLTSTVTGPIYGKLADLYGRKPVFMFGAAVFLAGSVACGVAGSMPALVAFRAVQGIGAGALGPIAITIIGDIFTLEERGRMQGFFGGVWGFSGIIGPTLGGVIVKYLSWRWVFFVNLPVGVLAMALIAFGLDERIERQERSLDIFGALTLSVAIVALLAAVGAGGWLAVFLVPFGALLIALFIWIERRVREPIMPIPLFTRPTIALANAAQGLLGALMIAQVTYIPLHVQAVLGGSPTEAGSAVTPMVITWPIASMIGGRLVPKIGFRPFVRLGFGIAALGSFGVAFFTTPGAPLGLIQASVAIVGLGLGFAATPLLLAVQTTVEWKERGIATAGTIFSRNIGGTLVVGVMGAILAATLAGSNLVTPEVARQILGPDHGRMLAPEILKSVSDTLEHGLRTIFWIVSGISVVAFLVGFLFPEIEIPKEEARGVQVLTPE